LTAAALLEKAKPLNSFPDKLMLYNDYEYRNL